MIRAARNSARIITAGGGRRDALAARWRGDAVTRGESCVTVGLLRVGGKSPQSDPRSPSFLRRADPPAVAIAHCGPGLTALAAAAIGYKEVTSVSGRKHRA